MAAMKALRPVDEQLESRVARLEELVATLLARQPGLRDAADESALRAIVAASVGHRFTARELWRHARITPALRDQLEAADVDNVRALGKLLARAALAGWTYGGLRLERTGDVDRDGLIWTFVRV
jgi:hypothetical protein